ncbi:peroxidase-related enzyme [Acidovorax sp. Leaf78]|uniref:CMD domain-containing protein n=1 Tax=Acidovorax sp. Leaf78 TaxID=1736237 RepID=UPI0009E76F9C|nr:peroxidase-related enzyme [Acidovorax sp. Leaf78]
MTTTAPDTTATTSSEDTIDTLLALTPERPAFATRHARDKVAVATQGCYDALFSADLSGTLTHTERLWVASDIAEASGMPLLAAHYRDQVLKSTAHTVLSQPLQELLQHPGSTPTDARLQAVAQFTRTLATHPDRSDRAALLALPAAGLSVADTVLLAQLIGFVTYQLRLVAGVAALDALGGEGDAPAAPAAVDAAPFVHPANLPAPGEPLRLNGYTSETLGWASWLPVVDPATATPEQQAVLDLSHPKARSSDFYLLLVHQARVLSERSQAFNAIMYAPGGLSRAEREVASTAVSRANGCVYCASVHAQRFEQLARRNDVMAQIFADPDQAGTNARERAIVQAALALTRSPGTFGAQHLQPLRAAGLSDLEILDALHASALFAWANRLMLNLGEAVFPQNA